MIFSRLKTKAWPQASQIVELVEKEINRIQNCIPDEDSISKSFIRNRALKSHEEIGNRQLADRNKKGLKNNYPNLSREFKEPQTPESIQKKSAESTPLRLNNFIKSQDNMLNSRDIVQNESLNVSNKKLSNQNTNLTNVTNDPSKN